ncbi:hypothetical protein C8J56DRAFT_1052371 [Mycena floridula]|nr:hypothetical protein C8J56DRAFT_1052371 [Mycena floridula]
MEESAHLEESAPDPLSHPRNVTIGLQKANQSTAGLRGEVSLTGNPPKTGIREVDEYVLPKSDIRAHAGEASKRTTRLQSKAPLPPVYPLPSKNWSTVTSTNRPSPVRTQPAKPGPPPNLSMTQCNKPSTPHEATKDLQRANLSIFGKRGEATLMGEPLPTGKRAVDYNSPLRADKSSIPLATPKPSNQLRTKATGIIKPKENSSNSSLHVTRDPLKKPDPKLSGSILSPLGPLGGEEGLSSPSLSLAQAAREEFSPSPSETSANTSFVAGKVTAHQFMSSLSVPDLTDMSSILLAIAKIVEILIADSKTKSKGLGIEAVKKIQDLAKQGVVRADREAEREESSQEGAKSSSPSLRESFGEMEKKLEKILEMLLSRPIAVSPPPPAPALSPPS